VGGCVTQSSSGDYYPPPQGDPGWGSGTGGSGGTSGYGCHVDTDCGTGSGSNASVCARDGECMLASQVRIIHVNWTVLNQPASTTTCSSSPNLDITFKDVDQVSFGFSPVPCVEGKFTVDKMPTTFTMVSLERAGDYNGGATGTFDPTTGTANLDLPY
jgi:hypothetical protein